MKAIASEWLDDGGELAIGVVVVALGGNLGGLETLRARCEGAIEDLSKSWGPAKRSTFLITAPVGEVRAQPEFLNAVAAFRPQPAQSPEAVLATLLALEQEHGRTREVRGGARTLDLDLLLVGQESRSQEELTLPHARMHTRAFVLLPLLELFGPTFRVGPARARVDELLADPEVASQETRPLL